MSSRTAVDTMLLDLNTPKLTINNDEAIKEATNEEKVNEAEPVFDQTLEVELETIDNEIKNIELVNNSDNTCSGKILKFISHPFVNRGQSKSERFISITNSNHGTVQRRQTVSELKIAKTKKILIFGGIDPHCTLPSENQGKSVLQYDLFLNHWEALSSMPGSRHHHSAVFCNGKIYIIGGTRPACNNLKPTLAKSMWSFDPERLEWTNEKSLPYPRRDFGMVATAKGLHVFGGENCAKSLLSSHIFYDIITRTWSKKSPLKLARSGLASILLGRHIWAAGGIVSNQNKGSVTDLIEQYDFKEDQWSEVGRLRIPRCFGRICIIKKSQVFIVGGVSLDESKKFSSIAAIDKYFFEFQEWKEVATMATARHGHDVVTVEDNIFIFGGVSTSMKVTLSSVECLCIKNMTWIENVCPMPTPSSGFAAVAFH